MLRRLVIFVVQFLVTLLTCVAGSAIYLLAKHGLGYRFSPFFLADMNLFTRVSLIVTIILFLVIICYRATRSTFQE